jgi:hypothetical protein
LIPIVPNSFGQRETLDLDKLGECFARIDRDLRRSLARRYCYSPPLSLSLDGVTNASAAVLRQLPIRRPDTLRAVEVVGVELVLYGNAAVTATVTCSDANVPPFDVECVADTATEVTGSAFIPVPIPLSTSDVTWEVSFSGAYTVTAGELIVVTRCDRGNQGDTFTPWEAPVLSAASAHDAALMDAQISGIAAGVARDTAADRDMRPEFFDVRSLAAGASAVWRLPSGLRRLAALTAYVVAGVGVGLQVTATGPGLAGASATATGTGAGTRAVAADTVITSAIPNDPTDSTDDTIVTLTNTGGSTIDLGCAILWFT